VIELKKETAKIYKVSRDGKEITTLKLTPSSITNKFHIICNFIEGMSQTLGEDFDNWMEDFLLRYSENDEIRYLMLTENIDSFKDYVNAYIDSQEIDFSTFVDMGKVKKSSILFEPYEIELITKLSGYLKLYSIIFNTQNLRVDQRLHKKIYNEIAADLAGTEIIRKVFDIVKTKTFRYNLTDRYMWDYIKMIQCKSIDVHVIEIFNFIMNSILILCEEDKNPITYFVSVVEESVKWFLRSVYKSSVIYEDSVSTENIHTLSVNNLKTYSYNDTLGRLKGIAYDKMFKVMEKTALISATEDPKSDKIIVEFQNRCYDIKHVSPLSECVVFPILAKVTNIPYRHFKTLSPEHTAVLSCYLYGILKKVFKTEYKNLFSLLDYFPLNAPAITTTYQIKLIHDFVNSQNKTQSFYGFNTKILPHKILSFLVGRISRVNFCNIFDGSNLPGIPLSKIEADMIKFYSLMFSGGLENEFNQIGRLINSDF